MSFSKLFNNVADLLSGKANQSAEKLVEDNPEIFLDKAIKNEKLRVEELKNALIEIEFHKKSIIEDRDNREEGLKKIEFLIKKAKTEEDSESELKGTELLNLRQKEYNGIVASLTSIEEKQTELLKSIKEITANINKMEIEKSNIIAELNLAKSRENIINITNQITETGNSSSESFAAAREVLEKKIRKVESMESINKKLDSKVKDDPFEGL